MFSSNGLGSVPDEAALRIKVYGKAIRIKSGLGLLGNRLDCAKDIACRRLDRTHDIGCRRQDETNDVGNQLVFRLQRRQYVERTRAVKGAVDIGCLERSEEHTSELQSRGHLVCRLLLEKKKTS